MHKSLLKFKAMKILSPQIQFALCGIVLLALTFFLRSPALADTFGSGTNTFAIDFVGIGNTGNAGDTRTNVGSLGYGAVPYEYRMGAYEITQNAITKATSLGMMNVTAGRYAGDRPAANISWYEAAAFVNFLNTNSGKTAAYKLTLSISSWSMALWSSEQAWTAGGTNLYRNKDAFYFLPSENEWYKAAFYNPGGSNYFLYATGSDSAPTAVASGTDAGTAVYGQPWPQGPTNMNLSGGLSPYLTMGQNGNVTEWMESSFNGSNNSVSAVRIIRGGLWNNPEDNLRSTDRGFTLAPTDESSAVGFRVASVPEPSTALLVLMAGGAWLLWKRSRRSV